MQRIRGFGEDALAYVGLNARFTVSISGLFTPIANRAIVSPHNVHAYCRRCFLSGEFFRFMVVYFNG